MAVTKADLKKITLLTRIGTHEAGHAVVAAYLRVPFDYVTLGGNEDYSHVRLACPSVRMYSYNKGTDSFRKRPWVKIHKEADRQILNSVIVLLGARAAVDSINTWSKPRSVEVSYKLDEQAIKGLGRASQGQGRFILRVARADAHAGPRHRRRSACPEDHRGRCVCTHVYPHALCKDGAGDASCE
jgi:hypothetical protein